mgnify:CR=1 FL=1
MPSNPDIPVLNPAHVCHAECPHRLSRPGKLREGLRRPPSSPASPSSAGRGARSPVKGRNGSGKTTLAEDPRGARAARRRARSLSGAADRRALRRLSAAGRRLVGTRPRVLRRLLGGGEPAFPLPRGGRPRERRRSRAAASGWRSAWPEPWTRRVGVYFDWNETDGCKIAFCPPLRSRRSSASWTSR